MTDLAAALRTAVSRQFPAAKQFHCYFHILRAVLQRVSEEEKPEALTHLTAQAWNALRRKTGVLVVRLFRFLQEAPKEEAYREMVAKLRESGLSYMPRFFDYLFRTYLNTVDATFPAATWAAWPRLVANANPILAMSQYTNNISEGTNSALKSLVRKFFQESRAEVQMLALMLVSLLTAKISEWKTLTDYAAAADRLAPPRSALQRDEQRELFAPKSDSAATIGLASSRQTLASKAMHSAGLDCLAPNNRFVNGKPHVAVTGAGTQDPVTLTHTMALHKPSGHLASVRAPIATNSSWNTSVVPAGFNAALLELNTIIERTVRRVQGAEDLALLTEHDHELENALVSTLPDGDWNAAGDATGVSVAAVSTSSSQGRQ